MLRIDGWSVGIVANQRNVVKSAKGEVQIGGVIYSDSVLIKLLVL
jgi:3-methylcrotonyl-CoA carboxylase beta subunit